MSKLEIMKRNIDKCIQSLEEIQLLFDDIETELVVSEILIEKEYENGKKKIQKTQ